MCVSLSPLMYFLVQKANKKPRRGVKSIAIKVIQVAFFVASTQQDTGAFLFYLFLISFFSAIASTRSSF